MQFKMIKIIFLSFLIIFIIYNNLILAQEEFKITNVSPDLINNFPSTLTTNNCAMNLFLLVENKTMPINNIYCYTTVGYGCSGMKVSENSTHVLFRAIFSEESITSYNVTVNGYEQELGYLNLEKNCIVVDVDSVTIDIIQDIYWNNLHKYSSIVRLNGVPDGYIMMGSYDTSSYQFTLLGDSVYRIDYGTEYFIKKINDGESIWSVDLKFPPNKILTVSVPFNKTKNPSLNNDEIIDFQIHPSKSPFEISSVIYSATVSFKSKNNLQRIPFSLFTIMNPYYFTPRPISGNSNDGITYAVTCLAFYESQYYSFYRQLSNSSYINDINLTVNVTFEPSLTTSIPNPTKGQVTDMDNSTGVPMVSFGLGFIVQYNFKFFNFQSKDWSDQVGAFYGFPFGFSSGNNFNYITNISIPVKETSTKSSFDFKIDYQGQGGMVTTYTPFIELPFDNGLDKLPTMISFDTIYIDQFKFLVRIHLIDLYGIKYINTIVDNYHYRWNNEYLVSGTIYDGVWEFIYDGVLLGAGSNTFLVQNYIDNEQYYTLDYPFTVNNPTSRLNLPWINIPNANYLDDLVNVSFLYNNVHVTNQSVDNIIYFTFNNIEQYKDLSIAFVLNDQKSLVEQDFQGDIAYRFNPNFQFAEWDESSSRFSVKFKMPANTMPGFLEFSLIFTKFGYISSAHLPDKYQLNVISPNIDIIGPVVTKLIKNPSNKIGWLFTIEDDINGFDHGYIIVRGTYDSSLYNISLKVSDAVVGSGDKWKADYLITIPIDTSNCFSQDYIITYAWLVDSFNNVNKYYKYLTPLEGKVVHFDATGNPFLAFLNDSTSLVTNVGNDICSTNDATPPTLIKFIASKTRMDVGLVDRSITFDFEAQDLESGLKSGQFPVVYLLTQDMDSVECVSSIVSQTTTNTVYTCTMDVPIGMGLGNNILVSVYGFINNGGYYSGFSSKQLKDLNQNWCIQVLSTFTVDAPIIKLSTSISNFGGNLWIYGRGLISVDKLTVIYAHSVSVQPVIIKSYDSAILIKNIAPTNQSFTVMVSRSTQNPIDSNVITVTPTVYIFNYTDPIYTQPPTPTPSSTPSTTPTIPTASPIPTNAPQKCKGNPQCGGPNNGVCTDKGCQCIKPWYGVDCTSKLVVVEPPPKNTSNPSIEIPIPVGPGTTSTSSTSGSSTSPSEILFKSLISIVSLREIDYNGKVVKTLPFNQWEYTEINSNTSRYETSLNVEQDKEPVIVTTTLQWFDQSSTVYFAGQELEMNPSSIKYNIDITSYPFNSQLNSLQLVMSATLISSSNDLCSSKQFGDTTTGDDSNFIKLQIDDHSVYGRFIKRAIVDDTIVSVSNILLDESMNSIGSTSVSQSYIGITIPFYSSNVTIDPDFSVLLDSQTANNDSENSICPKKSSGLSGGKIAGIAVGGFAFASVAVISVIYSVRKTKRDKKLTSKLNAKLSQNK